MTATQLDAITGAFGFTGRASAERLLADAISPGLHRRWHWTRKQWAAAGGPLSKGPKTFPLTRKVAMDGEFSPTVGLERRTSCGMTPRVESGEIDDRHRCEAPRQRVRLCRPVRDRSAGVGLHSGGSAGGMPGSEFRDHGPWPRLDTEDLGPGR